MVQIRERLAFSMFALFFVRRWNLTIGALIGDVAYNICSSADFCYFLSHFLATSFDEFAGSSRL